MSSLRAVRRAGPLDGPEVRRLVTESLLQAGFDAPDETRDADLLDTTYYDQHGRALWVAEDSSGTITGCAAIDTSDPGVAVLRRLSGDPLDDLVATAIGFARALAYREVETVIPHGMTDLERAVSAAGFDATSPGAMLYRMALPAG